MNRCATCKHYSVSYHPGKDGLADVDHISKAQRPTRAPGTQAVITATAADDQGISAVLMVGPDFGCVHHTPKKTKKTNFLQRVVRYVQAKIYPSARSARHYLMHETPAQYEARDAAAEAQGERYVTNLERFGQLDWLGRVVFALEGQVRHQRQEIYFGR